MVVFSFNIENQFDAYIINMSKCEIEDGLVVLETTIVLITYLTSFCLNTMKGCPEIFFRVSKRLREIVIN